MTQSDFGMCAVTKSITILEMTGYRAVLLIRCWSVLHRDKCYTGRPSVDYKNWTLSEVQWTTHIDIKQQLALHRLGLFLQPISNLHASLWNIPKQEMADCHVTLWVWAENTRTATTWHRSWGKDLALPRLFSQGQGQDFHEVSSRPRPGLEDNKTDKIAVHLKKVWCKVSLCDIVKAFTGLPIHAKYGSLGRPLPQPCSKTPIYNLYSLIAPEP